MIFTLGGDTFMQQRMELAGCRNAAEEIPTSGTKAGGLHTGLAEVSMGKVLEWNPDILVTDFGSPSDLYSDSRWSTVKAVRDRMVFRQPMGVFIWDRPTAESAVLHPLWLAKIAYPERFEDIDLVREIKDFYSKIMSFDLTDEQADAILSAKYTFNFMDGKSKPGR